MGMTRQQKQAALTHILEGVFDLDPDNVVHKALTRNAIRSPFDLITLAEVEYEMLKYEEGGAILTLPKGHAGLLKAFWRYVHYKDSIGETIQDTDWTTLTCDEFDQFRISPILHRALPAPPSTTGPPTPAVSLVREFRRGIKRDITHFIPLKDDGAWDNWERATLAQARAQDVADVLNPQYVPGNANEAALFDEK